MRNLFYQSLLSLLFGLVTSVSGQAQALLKKGDSLFAAQRFSEARNAYKMAFFQQKKTTPADLLKLSFIEEGMDDKMMSIFFLHQFYLFRPNGAVKSKIEDMAGQSKLAGYSMDEADYAYFLYRVYGPYVAAALLSMAVFLFCIVIARSVKRIPLGYSPIFTFIFLLAAGYLYNFPIPYKRAVLAEDQIFLMSGPSAGSSVVDVLSRGHRVEWIEQKDIWYEVKWNEKRGWVKKTDLLFFM